MSDLFTDIQIKIKELDKSVRMLRNTGTEYAESEKEYKIELRKQALKLRTEKDMPVTLIQQTVFGVPEVAELRLKRDIAEAVYKANQEAINSIKLQIRIMEGQLDREWSGSGN